MRIGGFENREFAAFARQLHFAPAKRRRTHLERAEELYWRVKANEDYPLDFVVFRITHYRPDSLELKTIPGRTLRHDLLRFVEELSATIEDGPDHFDPPPLTLKQLCEQLGVTTKTIQRYRRQGLFARRVLWPDGRRRLVFLPRSVERFLDSRGEEAKQSAKRFSRIDEPTQHELVSRARRLVARRPALTPFQVARHLSEKSDRSTEAIRQLLLRHDRCDPRVAIFPRHVPPLTHKQQRVIHRAWRRGVSVSRLCRRFAKSRNAIYRAIHRRRAAAIRQLRLDYVASPTFKRPDAEQVILDSKLPPPRGGKRKPGNRSADADVRLLYDEEPHTPTLERALFARYNFLKYQAAKLREQLHPTEPRSRELDQIETYLRWAVAIKVRIFRANVRLVVSVARKHLATQSAVRGGGPTLDELIAEGNRVLLGCIETFDIARRNRFASYLGWALMRCFAAAPVRHADAASPTATSLDAAVGEYWPVALNPAQAAARDAEESAMVFGRLLDRLDEQERIIVTRHFGVGDDPLNVEPQSLAAVAATLEMPVERARRIERRALVKIRRAAGELDNVTNAPGNATPEGVSSADGGMQ